MTAEDKQYEEEYHKWWEAKPKRKIIKERFALRIAWNVKNEEFCGKINFILRNALIIGSSFMDPLNILPNPKTHLKGKSCYTLPSVHIKSSLPQQNDKQQEEEDVVDISGVNPTVFLQRPLWNKDYKIQIA